MKILFTGASSFTGAWIVPALVRGGHDVTVTFTRGSLEAYDGLRRKRVERVLPFARAVWGVESGDDRFLALCRDQGPWDVLCLHGAEVGDYKAATFDWQRAVARNTRGYAERFAALAAAGGRSVVLTGSYFEAHEGNPNGTSEAASPYGLSKTLTWQACRQECLRAGLALGKFVIPNPVGPLEEPKLVASLVRDWRGGRVPRLRTPLDICDNLPVHLLASEYVDFVAEMNSAGPRANTFRRPSGWVESVETFSQRVAREFGRRAGASFAVVADLPPPGSKPTMRRNAVREEISLPAGVGDQFWSDWYAFYFSPVSDEKNLSACGAGSAFTP